MPDRMSDRMSKYLPERMSGNVTVPIDEEDVPAPLAVVPALGPELL